MILGGPGDNYFGGPGVGFVRGHNDNGDTLDGFCF